MAWVSLESSNEFNQSVMAFNYEKDSKNIVTITMDMDGRSANVINDEFSNLWIEVMERLENEKKLAGVIIASAKKTFLAGGDLEMIMALNDREQVFKLVEKLKFDLRKIEKLGRPIFAAINGSGELQFLFLENIFLYHMH